jgi:CheY-like chemotaxis protein
VDDNHLQRQLVARFLSDAGCRVETAADGVEALEKFTARAFDVIVCDCEMPRMNGLQLCRAIRELPGGLDPYLIMMTGRADAATARADSIRAGADAFLTKPCRPADLLQLIPIRTGAAALRW